MLMITAACLLTLAAHGQTAAQSARIAAEEQTIIKVFNEYAAAMRQPQPERDRIRERLLTDDYFYMGIDGLPADKKFVIERQKRNGLRLTSFEFTDLKVRRYKNTAILTARFNNSGVDRGQPFSGDAPSGLTTVMVKQKGRWRVAADIVGREIEK